MIGLVVLILTVVSSSIRALNMGNETIRTIVPAIQTHTSKMQWIIKSPCRCLGRYVW